MGKLLSRILAKKFVLTGILTGLISAVVLGSTLVYAGYDTPTSFHSDAQLRISGSTTCWPMVRSALGIADAGGYGTSGPFQAAYGACKAEGYAIGSDQGKGDTNGTLTSGVSVNDVGMSSSSNFSGLTNIDAIPFARDAVCIIVSNNVYNAGLQSLTKAQVKAIFEGYNGDGTENSSGYQTWDDVQSGLPSAGIKVVARETNSGTRGSLIEMTGMQKDSEASVTREMATVTHGGVSRQTTSAAMAVTVGQADNQIGYVGLDYTAALVGATRINIKADSSSPAVSPTVQNVTTEVYPLSRKLFLLKNKNGSPNTTNRDNFITFMLSNAGQNIVEAEHDVRLRPREDVSGNGTINGQDVGYIGTKWMQTGSPGWIPEDVDQNGTVNGLDVGKIGLWWMLSYS